MIRKYEAQNGKIWKSKITGDILSEILYLGINDKIENYEEIKLEVEENV